MTLKSRLKALVEKYGGSWFEPTWSGTGAPGVGLGGWIWEWTRDHDQQKCAFRVSVGEGPVTGSTAIATQHPGPDGWTTASTTKNNISDDWLICAWLWASGEWKPKTDFISLSSGDWFSQRSTFCDLEPGPNLDRRLLRQKFEAVSDSLSQTEIALSNIEDGVQNQFPENEHRADLLGALSLIRQTVSLTREAVFDIIGSESKVVDTGDAPTYKASNEPQ